MIVAPSPKCHRILRDLGGGTRRALSRFVIHGYRRSLLVGEDFSVQYVATTVATFCVGRYCRELDVRRFLPQSRVTAWLYVTNKTHTGICARIGVTGVDWASWVTAEDSPLLRST